MLHQSTFHFVDTEEQAKNFVEQRRKQRRKAWYTPPMFWDFSPLA